jgi:predicted ATP-grasp superfamily ATP-dependent carboligase
MAEATAIVTFLAATAGLTKTIAEIAESILEWMKKHKQQHIKILIEGPRNDDVVEVDEKWDSDQLAEKIHFTVREN